MKKYILKVSDGLYIRSKTVAMGTPILCDDFRYAHEFTENEALSYLENVNLDVEMVKL